MNITDEELLMLEHLTYLNSEVAETAEVDGFTTVNLETLKVILSMKYSNNLIQMQLRHLKLKVMNHYFLYCKICKNMVLGDYI